MLGLQAQVRSLIPCTHEQSRRPKILRDTAKASVTAAQPNNIRLTHHCSGPQTRTPHSCRVSTSTAPIDIGAYDMHMYFQTHAASVQILTRKCTVLYTVILRETYILLDAVIIEGSLFPRRWPMELRLHCTLRL